MPCPLFIPVSPAGDLAFELAPLGEIYGGRCASDENAPIPIDTLRACCNRGYARQSCERAASTEPDAIRFLIKSHSPESIEVAWSSERNHHPLAVGVLKLRGEAGSQADRLTLQAEAYASTYLRRTGRAR